MPYINRGGFQDLTAGKPSGYFHVDTDGTVRLVGTATTFEDLRIDGLSTRVGVVAPTDEVGFRGDNNFYSRNFVHNQADEVQFAVQLPHAWKEGSAIHPHVHFAPWATNAGAAAAKFIFAYYIANVNGTFPASPATFPVTKTWTGDARWQHLIAGGADAGIDMTGYTLSSILKVRMYRDNTVTNNLADKVALLYIDIHYEIDALGSDSEYGKA